MRSEEAKILFVDDEPILLEICSQWLSGVGTRHVVSTAADGQEALEMMAENAYDLLITDVNMPRMNGVTLVRQIAQLGKTLPSIIFVSGFGDVDEREMYGMGVETFLAKPVIREVLTGAVERALALRSSLWRTRPEGAPRQSVVIQANDLCDNTLTGGVALGRGGFSAHCASLLGLGRVSFECHLSERDWRISGEGYVRWRSRAEGMVGIEFSYLDESCRAAMIEEIDRRHPQAFIPAR